MFTFNTRNCIYVFLIILLYIAPIFFNVFLYSNFMFEWGIVLFLSIALLIKFPKRFVCFLLIFCNFTTKVITEFILSEQGFVSSLIIPMVGSTIIEICILILVCHFRLKHYYLEIQLKELSIKDSLTELYNRRYFIDSLNRLWATGKINNTSLLLFDVDYFKQINDNYGHPYGDHVLVQMTKVIREKLRVTDIFVRLGGDEFAIIMPNTSLDQAKFIAEEFRKCVLESNLINLSENQSNRISLSIGLSDFRNQASVTDFITDVDNLLYLAKKNGRNRVECSN